MIELRTLTDGGQSAAEVAEDVGTFLDGARETLDLALYDIRLEGGEADRVSGALVGAADRGVRVRLLYNIDHPGPIPVPPPPESVPDLIEAMPFETRPVSGSRDLMHHKYAVRDGHAVLTRLDELDDRLLDAPGERDGHRRLAGARDRVHAELRGALGRRRGRAVRTRGAPAGGDRRRRDPAVVLPRARRAAGPPDREALGKAKRRIRIASPVLTSGPILGTLAEIAAERRCDVAGVVDETQLDEVYHQWLSNGISAWKVPLLRSVIEGVEFTGKRSIPWSPESLHNFMHAKVVVTDDVTFVGSFNLSRSGERNAENVLEIHDPETADRIAAYIDSIRVLYPRSTVPFEAQNAPVPAAPGEGSAAVAT